MISPSRSALHFAACAALGITIPVCTMAESIYGTVWPATAKPNYATPYSFTTLAGREPYGFRDGIGSAARFNGIRGLAIDSAGNVFAVDADSHTIRKITPAGVVTTVAGSPGDENDVDGVGAAARFGEIRDVVIDAQDNVYVGWFETSPVSRCARTVRKITPQGTVTSLPTWGSLPNVFAAAGRLTSERVEAISNELIGSSNLDRRTMSMDDNGNVFMVDGGAIKKIGPDGTSTLLAGMRDQFGFVDGIGSAARFGEFLGAVELILAPLADGAGNIHVLDMQHDVIRIVSPGGKVSTLAEANGANAIACDRAGNTYTATHHAVVVTDPDGNTRPLAGPIGPTTGSADGVGTDALFGTLGGIALLPDGDLLICDIGNLTIRKMAKDSRVTTLAGTPGQQGVADGPGASAQFNKPLDIACDSAGFAYVADVQGEAGVNVRKISPAGEVTTIATLPRPYDYHSFMSAKIDVDGAGNVYVQHTFALARITPSGVVTQAPCNIGSYATALAVAPSGTIYLGGPVPDAQESAYCRIWTQQSIDPSSRGPFLVGQDLAIYQDGPRDIASIRVPSPMELDTAGNLYFDDEIALRKLTPDGVVTTLAGRPYSSLQVVGYDYGPQCGSNDGIGRLATFTGISGIAVDSATGTIYVADNTGIRQGVPADSLTITSQPQSQSATAGAAIQFSVAATGPLTLTYQWRFNGTPISGATAATLSLTSVTTADAGDYTVVVTNDNGSVTSSAAKLTVIAAPVTPTTPPPPVTPATPSSGGGGSLGGWFALAVLVLGGARHLAGCSARVR